MKEDTVKKLLKEAGYPDSVIKDHEGDDFDIKAVVADLHEKNKTEYTDIIKNELKPQIEEEITKRS